jgi:hypothetical protein
MHPLESQKCPYCNNLLPSPPKRKTKCKSCGNYYYVKTRCADRTKVIVTEAEIKDIEKEWSKYYADKNPRSPSYLISDEEFIETKASAISQGKYLSDNDIVWGLFNKKLNSCIQQNSWGGMKQIYYGMAILLQKEGKDCFHLLQEARRCELMDYKAMGITKVRILTAGRNNSCQHCLELDGKIFTIDKALQEMPIPVKNCSTEVFMDGKGFCRCIYNTEFR